MTQTIPSIGPIVQAIMASLPYPTEGEVPELENREPEPRLVMPEFRAERRDPLRNLWLNEMIREFYDNANPSLEARSFFSGKRLLELTLKTGLKGRGIENVEGGMQLFPQIETPEIMRSCAAFYQKDGWLCLWSELHGTGKTTFALWHILRHLRVLAEARADQDIECTAFTRNMHRTPRVAFVSWPRCVAEIKAQIGRRNQEAILPKLVAADILVVEDIKPSMSPYDHNLLEDLLGSRYALKRKTIICPRAEKDWNEVKETILGVRICSFIEQRGARVFVGGNSHRTSQSVVSEVAPY